jgi:hypothetical protein
MMIQSVDILNKNNTQLSDIYEEKFGLVQGQFLMKIWKAVF